MALSKNLISFAMLFLLQLNNNFSEMHASINNSFIRSKPSSRLRPTMEIRDKVIEWQCYARCASYDGFSSFEICKNCCKAALYTSERRGECPGNNQTVHARNELPFKLACLNECKVDFDCPAVQKCCAAECGPICRNPSDIMEDELLPPIPKIMRLKFPKGHKVELTIQTSANSTIYYHVETRYHSGLKFSPRKLSAWQWQPVAMTAEEILQNRNKRIQISFNLKSGRWYQVRIAAINEHGFRGYSDPSKSFILPKHPRPPLAPTDLQVVDSSFNGKYYAVNIVWCPSKSSLPIEKYKIIWSLYVKSKDESIISNEDFAKDSHQYEITHLLPDSSYYIQVLAMCIIGSQRLKSDKVSILFNTTTDAFRKRSHRCIQQQITSDQNHIIREPLKHGPEPNRNVTAYSHPTAIYNVRFHLNKKYGLMVQITGFQPDKKRVYELCSRDTNCEHRQYSAILAKKHTLEFSKLKYDTTYYLKEVEPYMKPESLDSKQHDAEIVKNSFSFQTPKCEGFSKNANEMLDFGK